LARVTELPLDKVVFAFLDLEEPTGGPEESFPNLHVFLEASEEFLLTRMVGEPASWPQRYMVVSST
jgi:hypothetical protein